MSKIIEKYYDLLSDIYDEKTPEFARIPCKKAIEMLQKKHITNLWKILDLWCGTGQVLDEIKISKILNEEYLWIDISNKMLDKLKSKYPKTKTDKIDIEKNFWNVKQKFDTVIMIWLFEFLTKKEYVLNQIYKKLNKWWHFLFSFENFVEGHPIQREKISPMWKIWNEPIHPLTNFDNLRYTIDEIKKLLLNKFEIIDHENFIWYYKTQDKIAIYYTNILAKKI